MGCHPAILNAAARCAAHHKYQGNPRCEPKQRTKNNLHFEFHANEAFPPHQLAKTWTCPAGEFGGAMGIRTPDLLIANETLYQLSYDPIHQIGRGQIWRFRPAGQAEIPERKKGAGDPSPAHLGGALTIAPPPCSAHSWCSFAAIHSAVQQRFNPMQNTGGCAGTPAVTPRHGRHCDPAEQSPGQNARTHSSLTNPGGIGKNLPRRHRNAEGIAMPSMTLGGRVASGVSRITHLREPIHDRTHPHPPEHPKPGTLKAIDSRNDPSHAPSNS